MTAKALQLLIVALVIALNIQCKKTSLDDLGDYTPKVGDFYVSPSGDDANPGTDSLPWRTIKKAISVTEPGQTVIVRKGFYEESVSIAKSGFGDDARINVFSEYPNAAKCLGFKIQGDYVTIDGFDIEASTLNWLGVYIDGGSNVDIQNCYIHECAMGGIRATKGANYIRIIDNKLEHNGLWGITLIGNNGLIEGNEVSKVVQYHPKGQEPGFSGADADGLRIFGDGHVIRGNKILDIGDPSDPGNVDPHVDAIQTWDGSSNGQPIMTNAIIEGNYIRVKHPTGKGIILETSSTNACHHILIRNNIIEFRDIGVDAHVGLFNNIQVYNNVFKANLNDASWGTSVHFTNVANYGFVNNITVDCHPEHRKIQSGSGVVDYNLAWNSDGSPLTMEPAKQAHDIVGVDPQFVTYTGAHGENDYHLKGSSPAVNVGITIEAVPLDYDGTTRPQGSAYDIGAFEFK